MIHKKILKSIKYEKNIHYLSFRRITIRKLVDFGNLIQKKSLVQSFSIKLIYFHNFFERNFAHNYSFDILEARNKNIFEIRTYTFCGLYSKTLTVVSMRVTASGTNVIFDITLDIGWLAATPKSKLHALSKSSCQPKEIN